MGRIPLMCESANPQILELMFFFVFVDFYLVAINVDNGHSSLCFWGNCSDAVFYSFLETPFCLYRGFKNMLWSTTVVI